MAIEGAQLRTASHSRIRRGFQFAGRALVRAQRWMLDFRPGDPPCYVAGMGLGGTSPYHQRYSIDDLPRAFKGLIENGFPSELTTGSEPWRSRHLELVKDYFANNSKVLGALGILLHHIEIDNKGKPATPDEIFEKMITEPQIIEQLNSNSITRSLLKLGIQEPICRHCSPTIRKSYAMAFYQVITDLMAKAYLTGQNSEFYFYESLLSVSILLAPEEPHYWAEMAGVILKLGFPIQAHEALKVAIDLDPKGEAAYQMELEMIRRAIMNASPLA
jgi:hypothetical protein